METHMDRLNFSRKADCFFLLRTIELAHTALDDKEEERATINGWGEWESLHDWMERLATYLRSTLEFHGLTVDAINRGTYDDGYDVTRPLTLHVWDADDYEIVFDLSEDCKQWSITEVRADANT